MKKTTSLAAAALACALLAPPQARAAILLNLTDPPDQTDTAYSLAFTAAGPLTTISIGGYQILDFEQTANIGVFLNGAGANLLGAAWTLTPAAPLFTNTFTYDDGTPVPALVFGSSGAGAYDTYAQTFATTAGQSYSVNFLFSNDLFGGGATPSGLLVTELSPPPVSGGIPEPSTWMLMLLGLAGVGFLGRRQTRPSPAAVA
ncbi:PEP-CTERM sorting domain-containing protein [uncultured Rhodoblastus sp.]|uniref:PEP-CTERM sorting domain-containing protein n=1 Tax=uncultured Rhodoblastus sp. TaxID=543037 RepID=UPI0025E385F5|nr:PEP-CTERM sorting domain-containing protein [uncultured Rhodoblastus sp.]